MVRPIDFGKWLKTGTHGLQQIRQPKLSDVIEQQLEFLILEALSARAKNSHRNANWQNSLTLPSLIA